jgi:ABC-type amino acid transport substrate-binding protein
MGMLSAFGQMAVALPFLLDMFRLPADLFQLYLLGSVITGRLATGLAAMHGVVISLLGATALVGAMSWRRLLQVAAIGLATIFVSMAALGFVLTKAIPYEYEGEHVFVSMRVPEPTAQVVGDDEAPREPLSEADLRRDRLDVIRARATIRIGYMPDRLPFAYRNKYGDVVGFDMEILHRMASDLGLAVEIVRVERSDIDGALKTGRVDLVAGGLAITPMQAAVRAYSTPYGHHSVGFMVRDHDRGRFSSLAKLRKIPELKIAIPENRFFEEPASRWLPDATLVPVSSPRGFLRGELEDVDGMLGSAEAAGAWSLIYPQFSVAVPTDLSVRFPMAFALPQGQPDWLNFVDSWIALATTSGIVDRAFSRWILGQEIRAEKERWSILGNVLGWKLTDADRATQ